MDIIKPSQMVPSRDLALSFSILLVLCAVGAPLLAQDVRFFRIGTGATSGTYFSIGGLIANVISNPPGSRACDRGGSCGVPGLIAVAQSTQGSVENVKAIIDGQLESALAQADVAYWAYHGTGMFRNQGPSRGLRAIAHLLLSPVHIVVRADSDLFEIADLRGRRVSLGETGSGSLNIAQTVLAAHGIGEGDFEPAYHEPGPASDLLQNGEIDAFIVVGGVPVVAVADLAQRLPIRLLPMSETTAEELVAFNPFLTNGTIQSGIYQGVGQTRSIGISTQWIVGAQADAEFVFELTEALWHEQNRPLFDSGPPEARAIDRKQALKGIAIPLHPGAARYYKEQGIQR